MNIGNPLVWPNIFNFRRSRFIKKTDEECVEVVDATTLPEEGLVGGAGAQEGQQQLEAILHHHTSFAVSFRPEG